MWCSDHWRKSSSEEGFGRTLRGCAPSGMSMASADDHVEQRLLWPTANSTSQLLLTAKRDRAGAASNAGLVAAFAGPSRDVSP